MQGFFNAATRPEPEPSRPRFVNPRTNEEQSWQRASNFAAPLESGFGMVKHKTRALIRGLNTRLDLARMLLTGAVTGDKVDEVIATALTAADDEAAANNGTAVHAALGLCDMGQEVPAEYAAHASHYVAELQRHGLRPVAVETRILNTKLGATGIFDRVYVTNSGRYLVGDIKTGSLKYPHKFAVQCEVYAGGDFIVDAKGNAEPIPWDIDRDAALLIHVDPEDGTTTIYGVPLSVARFGAALAEQIRAFQRMDVLMPFAAPLPAAPTPQAMPEQPSDPAYFGGPTEREDAAATQTPAGAAVPLDSTTQAAPAGPPTAPTASRSDGTYPVQLGTPEYEVELAKLMVSKNNKAALQGMLHALGGRDLAHNRKWLAEKIIELRNAAATGTNGAVPEQPSAASLAASVEEGKPPAESTPFLLKQIAEAASVGDITRLFRNITERSGPAAWTEEMTAVANRRTAELNDIVKQPPNIGAAPDSPETSPLSRIADAKSTQDLAAVWAQVTNNGQTMSAWTDAYDKAAKAKGAELTASMPPQNPWGTS